jgi:hypothetical protein
MAVTYKYTSHESFSHDSIDSLGYDWERVGNPGIKPKFPFKIYLPRSNDDVVRAVREARQLGQTLRVRSKGHSSNDLVLEEGGCILLIEKFNQILELNEKELTATVQSGTVLADLDLYLSERGFGLKIIGDHNHITAGGFASVGGISPASHRFGMFVDTVRSLEYVTWEGELVRCGRDENPAQFYSVLCGLGRQGVICTITIDIMRANKVKEVVRNHMTVYRDMEKFIADTHRYIMEPGDLVYERGVWADLKGKIKVGQFSRYVKTDQNALAKGWDKTAYGYLHTLGNWAGRLPDRVDLWVKYLGIVGVIWSPRYATMKNVEFFTDKILDSTVGDPTRMLIVLAPVRSYPLFFRELNNMCVEARERTGCFTLISLYVKAINSAYLAQGSGDDKFCELMLYVGSDPTKMTEEILNGLVKKVDALCVQEKAFRYMHTRTTKDPAIRRLIDPNAYWTERAQAATGGSLPSPSRDGARV